MRSVFPQLWIDEWLDAVVHAGARTVALRARHERFIIARLVSAAVALAASPLYLMSGRMPGLLDGLALLALAAPLVGAAVVIRSGRLQAGQALVSACFALLAAGFAAGCGLAPATLVAFLVAPLDALAAGGRRACAVAVAMVGAAAATTLAFAHPGTPAPETAAPILVAVLLATGVGHAVAQAVMDRRIQRFLQEAVLSAEARDGEALQAIDDLVTWHDRQGAVLRASRGAGRLLAVTSGSLLGRGLFDRVHVADRPAYLKAISDVAHSGRAARIVVRLAAGERPEPGFAPLPAAAGLSAPSFRTVELHLNPMVEAGESALVAVGRDVSHHCERIASLEATAAEVREASEARVRLLARAGEDLRAPLEAVLGYSELLTGQDGPGRDYAAAIHRSGQALREQIALLLDLASLDAGEAALAPEPIAVADLIREGCEAVALSAERAGVALARQVAEELPDLMADRRACRQMLVTLLETAVRNAASGALLTVQAGREADRLVLAVRESARGDARLARGRGPADPHSLPLAVARAVVALHKGRLTLQATPEGGFSATLFLPFDAGRPARAVAVLERPRPAPAASVRAEPTPIARIAKTG